MNNSLAEVQNWPVISYKLCARKPHPQAPVVVKFRSPEGNEEYRHCLAGMLPENIQEKVGLKAPPKRATKKPVRTSAPKPADYSKVPFWQMFGACWPVKSIDLIPVGERKEKFYDVLVSFLDPQGGVEKRKVPIARLPDELQKQVADMIETRELVLLAEERRVCTGKTARERARRRERG